jgi:hypothetical protein
MQASKHRYALALQDSRTLAAAGASSPEPSSSWATADAAPPLYLSCTQHTQHTVAPET